MASPAPLAPSLRSGDPEVQRQASKWLGKMAKANGIVIQWLRNDLDEADREGFGRGRNGGGQRSGPNGGRRSGKRGRR